MVEMEFLADKCAFKQLTECGTAVDPLFVFDSFWSPSRLETLG